MTSMHPDAWQQGWEYALKGERLLGNSALLSADGLRNSRWAECSINVAPLTTWPLP